MKDSPESLPPPPIRPKLKLARVRGRGGRGSFSGAPCRLLPFTSVAAESILPIGANGPQPLPKSRFLARRRDQTPRGSRAPPRRGVKISNTEPGAAAASSPGDSGATRLQRGANTAERGTSAAGDRRRGSRVASPASEFTLAAPVRRRRLFPMCISSPPPPPSTSLRPVYWYERYYFTLYFTFFNPPTPPSFRSVIGQPSCAEIIT